VPGETRHDAEVYVRDLGTHRTTMASVDSNGRPAPGLPDGRGGQISADGRFVAFTSYAPLVADDTNQRVDVYLRDMRDGTTQLVSVSSNGTQSAEGESWAAGGVSAHGEFVAFASDADDLAPGARRGSEDGFVRDVVHHTTTRVTVNLAGDPPNKGGLAPEQWASGIVPASSLTISADGRFVAFVSESTDLVPHDTNGWPDIFVRGPLRP
jgi:Tol biopolymer transport system component